jgi:hypothetical protein
MIQEDDLEQRPMVYGSSVQYLPVALQKNEVAKMVKMAVDSAGAIDACVSIIMANEVQKDSAAQLIVSKHIEEGLLYAIVGLAHYMADAGSRCLDKMDTPLPRSVPIARAVGQ